MSEIFNKYCLNKSRAEYMGEIVNAISHGRLKGNELETLINELSETDALNNVKIPRKSKEEWNSDYLELLTNEVVRGVFSDSYLRYLAEVSLYAKKNERRTYSSLSTNNIVKNVIILALIVVAVIAVLAVVNSWGNK